MDMAYTHLLSWEKGYKNDIYDVGTRNDVTGYYVLYQI